MMIPFDTWDMQSILIKEFDLQMTMDYGKTQHNILGFNIYSLDMAKNNRQPLCVCVCVCACVCMCWRVEVWGSIITVLTPNTE